MGYINISTVRACVCVMTSIPKASPDMEFYAMAGHGLWTRKLKKTEKQFGTEKKIKIVKERISVCVCVVRVCGCIAI